MKHFRFPILFTGIAFLLASSCEKDPVVPNEEEQITTLIYRLEPVAGGAPSILLFRDLDGDGGSPPVITGDTLMAGTIYVGFIQLLNESVNPSEDITEEIENEMEDHQFFYE